MAGSRLPGHPWAVQNHHCCGCVSLSLHDLAPWGTRARWLPTESSSFTVSPAARLRGHAHPEPLPHSPRRPGDKPDTVRGKVFAFAF